MMPGVFPAQVADLPLPQLLGDPGNFPLPQDFSCQTGQSARGNQSGLSGQALFFTERDLFRQTIGETTGKPGTESGNQIFLLIACSNGKKLAWLA